MIEGLLSVGATSVFLPFVVALLTVHTKFWWQSRSEEREWWNEVIAAARAVEEVEPPTDGEPTNVDADKRAAVADELTENINRLTDLKHQISSTEELRQLITQLEDLHRDNQPVLEAPSTVDNSRRVFELFSAVARVTRHHAELQRPETPREAIMGFVGSSSGMDSDLRQLLIEVFDEETVKGVETGERAIVLDDCVFLIFEDGWIQTILYDRPNVWDDQQTRVRPLTTRVSQEAARNGVRNARSFDTESREVVSDAAWEAL